MTAPDRLNANRGPLYDLLQKKLPAHRTGQGAIDVYGLAREISMTAAGIYLWFDKDRISPRGVGKLLVACTAETNLALLKEAGEDPLTQQDFLPFLFA